MNFLVRKDRMCGPHHGVLFKALDEVYYDSSGAGHAAAGEKSYPHFNILEDSSAIGAVHENLHQFFNEPEKPGAPRALMLSIDWSQHGSGNSQARAEWANFIDMALSKRLINDFPLAEDVDLFLLVDDTLYPEPFQHIDPATTRLLDYSGMDLNTAIDYAVSFIKEAYRQEKPYVPSWKRDQEPDAGPTVP